MKAANPPLSREALRAIWICFLVAFVFYVTVPEKLHMPYGQFSEKDWAPIGFAAYGCLGFALFRHVLNRQFKAAPPDLARAKWSFRAIVGMAGAESIGVSGFFARLIHSPLWLAAGLYALGLLLLILWRPSDPPVNPAQ